MNRQIFFIDETANIGGAEINLLVLLPELKKEGWEPHVALPQNGPLAVSMREKNIPVHIIPGAPKYSVSFYMREAKVPNPLALVANALLGIVWGTWILGFAR